MTSASQASKAPLLSYFFDLPPKAPEQRELLFLPMDHLHQAVEVGA